MLNVVGGRREYLFNLRINYIPDSQESFLSLTEHVYRLERTSSLRHHLNTRCHRTLLLQLLLALSWQLPRRSAGKVKNSCWRQTAREPDDTCDLFVKERSRSV